MWWSNLFKNLSPASFFNFSFLPKYGSYFWKGIAYTLLLAVVSVLLAIIPALLLAMMRLSKNKVVKGLSGAYIAVFRSTPLLVQLSIIYFGLFGAVSIPRITILGFVDISRFISDRRRPPVLSVSTPGPPCALWCCPRQSKMCCRLWPMRLSPW